MVNFKVANRLNLGCSQHKGNNHVTCMIKVLTNVTIVIILQYINVSNQQWLLYLNLHSVSQFFLSLKKKELRNSTKARTTNLEDSQNKQSVYAFLYNLK